MALYASVYSLVIITAERYFKIVHPVLHRNHYRRWMTYMGVATPWLIGLLTSAVPAMTTTRFVDGECQTQVRNTALVSTQPSSYHIQYASLCISNIEKHLPFLRKLYY